MAKRSRRAIQLFLVVVGLVAGCAQLKQCAYRGINRDQWQQPEKVIAALQIRPGEKIADLGAGGGYFTFKLAAAAGPTGKVYAVDVDREMVELINKQAQKDSVKNVETILAKIQMTRCCRKTASISYSPAILTITSTIASPTLPSCAHTCRQAAGSRSSTLTGAPGSKDC